jgi:IclR family acetate operon transcriptional repressor
METIARCQPIGVSELARVLGDDKSAVQRAIMTLADDGWIQAAPGAPTRWRLTGHIQAVAHMAQSGDEWRRRARGALEALRDETGESVLLTAPDLDHYVVIDVLESRQLLRTAPHVGMIVTVAESATGRALLPYLSREQQVGMLGGPPGEALIRDIASVLEHGYSVSTDDAIGGSVNIAAPLFEVDGSPAGAIVVSAPRERLTAEHYPRIGAMVVRAAHKLSAGAPPRPALLETALHGAAA